MKNESVDRFDVYDAAIPIIYGYAELHIGSTLAAPDEVKFDGSPQTHLLLKAPNIKRCGRWRIASIQIVPEDSLIVQQAFFCTIRNNGMDTNTGTFLLQSGVTYYPGTLLGEGFQQIIGVVCHNLTAAADGHTFVEIGIIRTDATPGSL